MFIKKEITFYANTPFQKGDNAVYALKLGEDIDNLLGGTRYTIQLNECNFRPTDKSITIIPSEDFGAIPNISITLNKINYMKLNLYNSGYINENFYFYVTGWEFCDTETKNDPYDVGAIRIFFELDFWNTYVRQNGAMFSGGTLLAYSNEEILQNLFYFTQSKINEMQKRLPIDAIAATANYQQVNVKQSEEETILSPHFIPQFATPVFWALGGQLPQGVATREKWRCVVILSTTYRELTRTITLASPPADDVYTLYKYAGIAGAAINFANKLKSQTAWGNARATIQNVYLLPSSMVNTTNAENTQIDYALFDQDQMNPSASYLEDRIFYLASYVTTTKRINVDAFAITNQATIGTPFTRIKLEQLGRITAQQSVNIECKIGGDTLRVYIKTGADVVDVTQDFEYLIKKNEANAYWQENKSAIALQSLATAGTLAVGVVSGNPLAIGGALLSGAQQIAQISQNLKQAPQIAGGGYADITILYGGIYVELLPAQNLDAINSALLTQGVQTLTNIAGPWEDFFFLETTNKRHFLRVENMYIKGAPQDATDEIRKMFANGLTIYTDYNEFTQRGV